MIWQSFKPLVWIILAVTFTLLVLAGMVSADRTEFIVPPPENAAGQLVSALSAHRYEGAKNQLSQELKQQVTAQDLEALVKTIEDSPAKGIEDAHEQGAEEQDSQAIAEIEVKLANNTKTTIHLPLVKEHGIWRVSSLDPLRSLGGQ